MPNATLTPHDMAGLMHRTATPSSAIVEELRSLACSADYPLVLRRSAQLAARASQSDDPYTLACGLVELSEEGTLSALLAIESLVGVDHRLADEALTDLLSHPDQLVRRHAGWRLGERHATRRAIPALLDLLTVGGIDTMHAHRTLRCWAESVGPSIMRQTISRFVVEPDPAARARLVDLLGVIGRDADEVLLHVAMDVDEVTGVRAAAIGALGERLSPRIDDALHQLASLDEVLGTEAALALNSRAFSGWPPHDPADERGLRIAQLVLASGLDGQLSLGGRGDTGGVASLLVSLGEALAHRPDVDHVLTIGRGTTTDAVIGPLSSSRIPLSYGMVAFGDEVRSAATPDEFWEHLPAIERGIRRVLRLAGPVDLLHLRMADVGTVAGAVVASSLGLPICFSVAPDPHNVVDSLHSRGELDDESFLRLATDTHVWFRARLIERLAREADRLALFPRREPMEFLDDIGAGREGSLQHVAVVAEGIDINMLDRAAERFSAAAAVARRGDVLDDLAAMIPESRRGLPLVLSVGRMNPVKGMERVVSAWAGDQRLVDSCNLVIVGGDLDHPSQTELTVLAAIDRVLPVTDPRRAGLVLLGGRPRADVARLLVATVSGRAADWSGGGVYVDGALKEEFGLAVLEAMAAGLVVVAPCTGGPSTYVEHGDTGVLVDPADDLGVAIRDAFGLVARPGRAQRARTMVEERYSIETMAAQLVDLYRPAMALR